MSTIVCLVSHQAMANVIPVLEMKPNKVILLQTTQESNTSENLRNLFNSKNIKTEIFEKFIDPYNLETVKSASRQIINNNESDIVLNVTGGTKPMAIAAYEIFKSSDKAIVYYDPVSHSVMAMNPINVHNKKVTFKINVEDYLLAHGYSLISDSSQSGRAEIKHDFFNTFSKDRFKEFIKFYSEVREKTKLDKPKFELQKYNFKFSKSIDKITIIDELSKKKIKSEHQNFNFGDVLEDILFMKLKEKDFDDIKYSVKISKDNIHSEIDVLQTHNCKLFLYSCKDKKKLDKFDLFEVEVLRNVAGGTFGKAHFVVTKKDEYIKRVANNLNIQVIEIDKLFS